MTSRLRSDRPQKAAAMDLPPLAGLTMSATEPPEHAMSVTDRSPLTHPDPGRLRNRAIMAACALITVGALTGTALLLTSNSTKPGSQTPSPPVSSGTPSSGTGASTPTQLATTDAQFRYRAFIGVKEQVGQGGYLNTRPYNTVVISPERIQLLLEAQRFASQHVRVIGNTEISWLTVQSVTLPADPNRTYPEVRLLACLDVSKVDVVTAQGRSVVAADRLNRTQSEVLMRKIPRGAFTGAPNLSGWFVTDVKQPGKPC